MSRRLEDLQPLVREKAEALIAKAHEVGLVVIVTHTLRTIEEQDELWRQGRFTPGVACMHKGVHVPIGKCVQHPFGRPVTNARGGDSIHNYGLAFDVAIINLGRPTWDDSVDVNQDGTWDYEEVGKLGESLGLEWGGRWHTIYDPSHFQFTNGLTLAELKAGRTF